MIQSRGMHELKRGRGSYEKTEADGGLAKILI
jgi:hypothetical protein